jgi:hypothetical protein
MTPEQRSQGIGQALLNMGVGIAGSNARNPIAAIGQGMQYAQYQGQQQGDQRMRGELFRQQIDDRRRKAEGQRRIAEIMADPSRRGELPAALAELDAGAAANYAFNKENRTEDNARQDKRDAENRAFQLQMQGMSAAQQKALAQFKHELDTKSQGGPYQGQAIDAQDFNILLNPNSDPNSPVYKAAHSRQSQAKIYFDQATGQKVEFKPDLSWARPPGQTQNSQSPAAGTPAAPAPNGPPQPTVSQVAPPRFNDTQNAAHGYAQRVADANKTLDEMEKWKTLPSLGDRQVKNIPFVGNTLATKEAQMFDQTTRNFINATLRRESGAAISAAEFANAQEQYIPQPGDQPAVLALKRQNRQRILESLATSSGRGQDVYGKPTSIDTPDPKSIEDELRRRGVLK